MSGVQPGRQCGKGWTHLSRWGSPEVGTELQMGGQQRCLAGEEKSVG